MNQYNTNKESRNKAELLNMCDQFYNQQMSADHLLMVGEAKKKERPDLDVSQWNKNGYFQNKVIQILAVCEDQIERVELTDLHKTSFEERCIRHNQPIIVTGCTHTWKNKQFWTHRSLASRFGSCKFKVGEDDDGNKIKMPLNVFMKYLLTNTDDSPLYLFADITNTNLQTQEIIEHYEVAQIFAENLLELLDSEDRPAYKWLLIGPERSGSGVHVDPILTCAWNTSLVGCKRWVLFDGKAPQHIVTGKEFKKQNETDQPIDYFLKILPQIKEKYNGKQLGLRQFIQRPGETVFVPGGVWHAVINLDDTVAVTQNFVSSVNLEQSWPTFMQERGELVIKMLQKLRDHVSLAQRVANLSKQSSQWRETFGLKYQREAKANQQIFFENTTHKEAVIHKRRSLSSSNKNQTKSKSPTSQSVKKKSHLSTDQQWFQ